MSDLETNMNEQEQEMPVDGFDGADEAFVTDEPRGGRSAGLVVLAFLVVGAGGIYFMRLRSGPATAAASAEVTSANATIDNFLKDGGKNAVAMRELLKNTESFIQQFINSAQAETVQVEKLDTNPFRFAATATEDPDRAERESAAKKEKEKAQVLRDVQALQLQSVISGRVRTCMINNRACVEGDQIEGFTIEQINASDVTVRKGGYRLRLSMKR